MDEPTIWHYLSKVTLDDIWKEVKDSFYASIFMFIIFAIFWSGNFLLEDTFISKIIDSSNNSIKSIPSWIYYLIILGLILWFGRGKTIKIPNVDFKLWFIMMIISILAVMPFLFLPWQFAFPIFWIVSQPLYIIDRLVEIGKYKNDNVK